MGIIVKTKEGKELEMEFRMLTCDNIEPDMIEGHISCIKDEYDDSYPYTDYIDAKKLTQFLAKDKLIINVVYTMDGEPIATLILNEQVDFSGVGVVGMSAVKKKYRGFGIFRLQLHAIMCHDFAKRLNSFLIYATTYHSISQRVASQTGFIPCGFNFDILDNINFRHSYKSYGIKRTLAVCVKPHIIKDVGAITVPPIHKDFIENVYKRMGVSYSHQEKTPLKRQTQFRIKEDEFHQTGYITVHECGEDLVQCMRPLLEEKINSPFHTINLLLNMKDSSVVVGFELLLQMGFLFSGIQPLSQDGEYILMHHQKSVLLELDNFVLDTTYIPIFEYIKKHIKMEVR